CRKSPAPFNDVGDGEHYARCHRVYERLLDPSVVSTRQDHKVGDTLLEVQNIWCSHGPHSEPVVRNISFSLRAGETLGIVGESGSGKSTLLRAIAGMHPPVLGSIRFRGADLPSRVLSRPRTLRHDIQLIFQNPDSSLNPRHS